MQNSVPPHSSVDVAAWIPGSPRRRFAAATPWDDEAEGLRPTNESRANAQAYDAKARQQLRTLSFDLVGRPSPI
ncbi:hypothetical protein EOA85_20470 [Mesorhizobium sp. M5C.F.Ca.IN.020.29.1.1]|nr:hypothetical protein EOA85_20470 [Mesorhizobium sp. M5C.F.Ca.IN.020.29.1.1]TIM89001.1 MAG: hypothetical protein E5Y50_07060 [Mesorhizobium sp.]